MSGRCRRADLRHVEVAEQALVGRLGFKTRCVQANCPWSHRQILAQMAPDLVDQIGPPVHERRLNSRLNIVRRTPAMQTVEVIQVVDQESHFDVGRVSRMGRLLKGWVVHAVVNSH